MINSLIDKLKLVFLNHKLMILYIFFGGITTVVNYIVYYFFDYILIEYTLLSPESVLGISNASAWIIAVIVAFITNKLFVFESKSWNFNVLLGEFIPFILARILSFAFDMGFMFIGVVYFMINDFIVKTFSNIFVLLFNYVASKFFIFKK